MKRKEVKLLSGTIIALQFLTKFRIGQTIEVSTEDLADSMIYFPIVGFLLGCLLVVENFILIHLLPRMVVDVILIISLIYFIGGLHLDGLADCFDAFYAGKNKQHILSIMKDSYLGSMGTIALICLLGLKWSSLYSISPAMKNAALLLMPIMGKWAMVLAAAVSTYARKEGVGKPFADHVNLIHFLKAGIMPLLLALLFLKVAGVIFIVLILTISFIIIRYVKHKIEGITGDVLGAVNEIVEVMTLLIILVFSN